MMPTLILKGDGIMYLRLKECFRPIGYDNFYEIFDNLTANEYELEEEQCNFLLLLDGTRTREEIINEFVPEDHAVANKFLYELDKLNALEDVPNIEPRIFPQNLPKTYLEAVLWDITSFCNLRCTHCYVADYFAETRGADMTTEEIFRLIDEMASMNVRDVSLTGGEPILRKDIQSIIKKIVNSNIRLAALFTNGIAMNQDFVDFLKRTVPNKYWIRHSLDGMTPKSNAILRGDLLDPKEIFEKMIDSIRMLVSNGLEVSVGTGVHRYNVDDIPRMYSFMKDLGVTHWRLAIPKPIGRYSLTQERIEADWSDIEKAYQKVIEMHLGEIEISNGRITAPIALEIEQIFFTESVARTMNGFCKDDPACFYHKNRCAIKSNGDVLPCSYFDDIVGGNVKNNSLKNIWESDNIQNIKKLCVKDVAECRECSFIRECGTGCRSIAQKVNGSLMAKDPYACHQAKFLRETVAPLFEKNGFVLKMSDRCVEFQ